MEKYEAEHTLFEERGWRITDAYAATPTPWDYQRYVRASRGEFSCAKPSCILLQNAWVSDRTLCYLASGKPAIVQHTGPSRLLPDADGLYRFRDIREAADALDKVEANYEHACLAARQLAEEYFDAETVTRRVLELALA
jgi:glycosyltransferase involved in cell wall biosynthesis